MIDTMEIYYQFKTKKDFYLAVNQLNTATKKYSNKKIHCERKDKNVFVTYVFAEFGFEEIKMRNNGKGFFAIEIKLRPKLLVDAQNYINVLYNNEIEAVRLNFNSVFENVIKINAPDYFKWKVKRIDYAIDISVKQNLMPYYMQLFSMGNIPEYALKNSTTREYIRSNNNCYIRCKGYTVNFYDRYTTLLDKQRNSSKFCKNIESAKNIMRFEIQIKVDTYKLKSKEIIKENSVAEFMNSKLCKHYIRYHFNTIIGAGNYYSLEKAKALLIKKSKTFSLSFQLIKILELINTKGSTYKAKKAYLKSQSDSKKAAKNFSNHINDLRHMGINQVTLPSDFKESLRRDNLDGLKTNIEASFESSIF